MGCIIQLTLVIHVLVEQIAEVFKQSVMLHACEMYILCHGEVPTVVFIRESIVSESPARLL